MDLLLPAPQRLDDIIAFLQQNLFYGEEIKDYYFVVDPVDRQHVGPELNRKLRTLLSERADNEEKVKVYSHFAPDTDSLVIANCKESIRYRIEALFYQRVDETVEANLTPSKTLPTSCTRPSVMPVDAYTDDKEDVMYRWPHDKAPHCVLAFYPHWSLETKPSVIVHCSVGTDADAGVALNHPASQILDNIPNLETVVRIDFRGFTRSRPFTNSVNSVNCEQQQNMNMQNMQDMKRIAELSEVVTCKRNKQGEFTPVNIEKLSDENGIISLPIRAPGIREGTRAFIRFTEIMEAVRQGSM